MGLNTPVWLQRLSRNVAVFVEQDAMFTEAAVPHMRLPYSMPQSYRISSGSSRAER